LKDESNIGNNRKRTSFETTYKMSTYLVAFVIAPDDFGYVEQKTLSGIPVNNKLNRIIINIYKYKFLNLNLNSKDKSIW
jgi:aminopeptidase N